MRTSRILSVMRRLTMSWPEVSKRGFIQLRLYLQTVSPLGERHTDDTFSWQPHKDRLHRHNADTRRLATMRKDAQHLYRRTLKALRKADRMSESLGETACPSMAEFYTAEVSRMLNQTRSIDYNLRQTLPAMKRWSDRAIEVRQRVKTRYRSA